MFFYWFSNINDFLVGFQYWESNAMRARVFTTSVFVAVEMRTCMFANARANVLH